MELGTSSEKTVFRRKNSHTGGGGGGGLPTWEFFPHNTVFGSEDVPYFKYGDVHNLAIFTKKLSHSKCCDIHNFAIKFLSHFKCYAGVQMSAIGSQGFGAAVE